MMQKLNLYTSNPADARFRSLATLLSQEQPTQLRPLSELPAPDLQRLRTEQAFLIYQLERDRTLLQLAQPHVRLTHEITDLQYDITRYEQRLAAIEQQLQQEGGQDNG